MLIDRRSLKERFSKAFILGDTLGTLEVETERSVTLYAQLCEVLTHLA